MIRVYLVRHGIAADAPAGEPDESRPLTAKGRKRFRKAARAFARLGEEIDALFTSPLVRSVQTAEILARAIRRDEVSVLEELRPGTPVSRLLATLASHGPEARAVALVGHDPQMSHLVAALARLPPEQEARVQFPKGAIVRIDVDAFPPGKSEPHWYLDPESREVVDGLPLAAGRA